MFGLWDFLAVVVIAAAVERIYKIKNK